MELVVADGFDDEPVVFGGLEACVATDLGCKCDKSGPGSGGG